MSSSHILSTSHEAYYTVGARQVGVKESSPTVRVLGVIGAVVCVLAVSTLWATSSQPSQASVLATLGTLRTPLSQRQLAGQSGVKVPAVPAVRPRNAVPVASTVGRDQGSTQQAATPSGTALEASKYESVSTSGQDGAIDSDETEKVSINSLFFVPMLAAVGLLFAAFRAKRNDYQEIPRLAMVAVSGEEATNDAEPQPEDSEEKGPPKKTHAERVFISTKVDLPESLVRSEDGPEGNYPMRLKMETMLQEVQISITKAIEEIDGGAEFREDAWTREEGGGGRSRVLVEGNVWEKAGVNLSVVYGKMSPAAFKAANPQRADQGAEITDEDGQIPFFATGLSSVMHPRNPFCPTMHFNYRYFETDGGTWWFGGGTDITPSYVNEDDMKHFHGTLKEVCDRHNPEYHPKFKTWADKYFRIEHRDETRGLGGIFFDDLDGDPDQIYEFVKDCANNVLNAYAPIIKAHKNDSFTEEEKRWQQMRRGRYVEFNLVYDRGTLFGLKTGGRIESILMSLPETTRWEYGNVPEEGSKEADFINACKNPREWV